jgi:predicted alpha/beta-fold hydrolase
MCDEACENVPILTCRDSDLMVVLDVASFVGGLGFAPRALYSKLKDARRPAPTADLVYCRPQADMQSPEEYAAALRIERIVDACPSVREPQYRPRSWYAAPLVNSALSTAKRAVRATRASGPPFRLRTEEVPGTDGDLQVVWAHNRASLDLPADAPVVMYMHTITGDAASTVPLLRQASRRGWRSCVLLRRGHAGPLQGAPRFNVLGDVDDASLQVQAVRAAFPSASFVGLIGVSAGSGLLVSYCGQSAPRSRSQPPLPSSSRRAALAHRLPFHAPPAYTCLRIRTPQLFAAGVNAGVDAAVSLCPAYDIQTAFASLGETSAQVEGLMVRQLKRTFVQPNEELLRAHDAAALERCLEADSLDGFIRAHAPFALGEAGADKADYYDACNPMEHFEGVRVPTLVVNSMDDMVCRPHNIRCDLVRQTAGYALVRTSHGSHVAFNEGFFAQGCFMSRIAFDFFDAARTTVETPVAEEAAPTALPSSGVVGRVVPTRTAAVRPQPERVEQASGS